VIKQIGFDAVFARRSAGLAGGIAVVVWPAKSFLSWCHRQTLGASFQRRSAHDGADLRIAAHGTGARMLQVVTRQRSPFSFPQGCRC